MTVIVHKTWHGNEIQARGRRATGRAIVGMAEGVAVEMQKVAHVESGNLKRSIHAAPTGLVHNAVEEATGFVSDPLTPESARTSEDRWHAEVGSWMPYACVENNLGGAHRFADIGWAFARPTFEAKLARAWREEGL